MRLLIILLLTGCAPKFNIGDKITFQGFYGKCSGLVREVSPWPYQYSLTAKCDGVKFPVVTTVPESYLVR